MKNIIISSFFVMFFIRFTGSQGAQEKIPSQEIDFVVLGKTINHRQNPSGELTLLNHHFFGEIFISKNGTVSNSNLIGPGDAKTSLPFLGSGKVLELHGGRHMSIEELDMHFPDSTYFFNFDTPSGEIRNLPATFSKQGQTTRNPGPIKITLSQNGHRILANNVDPNLDLTVTWSDFTTGNSDPNNIIDDLVFVITGDCYGTKIAHSGAPFGEGPYLTFRDKKYVVPNELLSPGKPFQVSVELAEMDTSRFKHIPIIVTYAATSFLNFKTSGPSEDDKTCPQKPYKMDKGQTDQIDNPKSEPQ